MARPAKEDEVTQDTVAKKQQYKVVIHSAEGDLDSGDVILCHNYRHIQIKRDVEVTLDAEFVEACLEHSKIETLVDGKLKTIPRFSYTATKI